MTISPALRDVATMTAELRQLEKQAARVSERRAAAALRHHARGMTYAELAEAMGVSVQAVFKILTRAAAAMDADGIKDACQTIRMG